MRAGIGRVDRGPHGHAHREHVPHGHAQGGPQKGEPSKTRTEYLYRLAGERITHEPSETFRSFDMERGQYMEAEARDYYAFTTTSSRAAWAS
jgi:hypothetical protein